MQLALGGCTSCSAPIENRATEQFSTHPVDRPPSSPGSPEAALPGRKGSFPSVLVRRSMPQEYGGCPDCPRPVLEGRAKSPPRRHHALPP